MMNSSSRNVILTRCADYSAPLLQKSVDCILSHLELPVSLAGSTVLLKPNLISSRGPALACTHPELIAVVACLLRDCGAKIKIGDSPAFGTTTSVMERHGMMEKLAGLPVELVHLQTPVARTVSTGLTVQVAAEALECDLMINMPKLKAHNQMYMTGAVKNFFGVVVGVRKAMLHMRFGSHREFSNIILGIPELFPSTLSIVDGVEVMHRSGPLDGEPLQLHLVGGSNCPVALDTSLLTLLELPVQQSPLWHAAARKQHPGSSASTIRYPELIPDDFFGSSFIAPESLNPIRFNPLRLISSAIKRIRLAISQ